MKTGQFEIDEDALSTATIEIDNFDDNQEDKAEPEKQEENKEEKEDSSKKSEEKEEKTDDKSDDNSDDKSEEKQEGDKEEKVTAIQAAIKSFEFDFVDTEGKAIEFTNDVEGIVNLAKTAGKIESNKIIQNFFNEYPETYDLYLHRKNGGSVDTFLENRLPDYSSIEIDEKNEVQLKQVYTQYLKKLGNTDEEINDLIDIAKTKGSLVDKSKSALDSLKKFSENESREREQRVIQEKRKEEEISKKIESDVKETIAKGKLLSLDLDAKTKAGLTDFLFTPATKDGKTKAQLADESLTLEQELYIKYLQFKNFNVGSNVKKVIQSLEELSTKRDKIDFSSKQTDKSDNGKFDINTIDFSKI